MMPLKAPGQKKTNRADVAEKVREIKQRQENWFKQRSSSLQPRSAGNVRQPAQGGGGSGVHSAPVTPVGGPTHTHPGRGVHDGVRHPHTSPGQGQRSAPPPAPNKGFQNWLQVRQEDQDPDGDKADKDGGDADGTQYLSRIHHSSLSPEMFDVLADQIASRVKKELRINEPYQTEGRQELVPQRSRTGSSDRTSGLNQSTGLESHHCQLCAQVMLPPGNSAMLLIPCGHTYCEQCLDGRARCPGCRTAVQNVTSNVMLQQIIAEYRERRLVERAASGGPSADTCRRNRADVPRDKVECSHNYAEEYQTLEVRREVLESEAETIREGMAEMDRDGERCRQQVAHIETEAQRLQQQVAELLQRQRDLEAHRRDYESQGEALNDRRREEGDRLKMVNATLRTLATDMDKIRMLANNFSTD